MTFENFRTLVEMAAEYASVEDFAAQKDLPPFMHDDAGKSMKIWELAYAAAQNDFKAIEGFFRFRADAARYLGIPAHNIERWAHSDYKHGRTPPKYLAVLAAFAIVSKILSDD